MNAPSPQIVQAVNLSKLARDVAMDIFPLDHIKATHQLSDEHWNEIFRDPHFVKMLGEMILDWRSASGTRERVKIKAQTAVEAALETFFVDMNDRDLPLVQRVDALKMVAKLGDLGEKDLVAAGGSGSVSISISLGVPGQGAEPHVVTIEGTKVEEGEPTLVGVGPS